MSPNTAVDWDMYCRERCEMLLMNSSEKIGGPGKRVHIDDSKVGKRKYHRGHIQDVKVIKKQPKLLGAQPPLAHPPATGRQWDSVTFSQVIDDLMMRSRKGT